MKQSTKPVRIPEDSRLPRLELMLNPDRVLPLLQLPDFSAPPEKCSVEYLRYKPGTNCIVLYRVRLRGGHRTWAYGKMSSTAREPRSSDRTRLSRYYPDKQLAFAVFPRDLQIPSLYLLDRPQAAEELLKGVVSRSKIPRFKTQVSQWAPIRYKPERRCVMKGSYGAKAASPESDSKNRVFYARFYADSASHQIASWYRHFSELDSSTIVLPRFIGYGRRRRLLLLHRLRGRPLLKALRRSDEECESAVNATARALATWHKLDPPSGTSPLELSSALTKTAVTLQALLPDSPVSPTELAEELARTAPEITRSSLLHGDFYYDQVLIKKNDSVALLDLDRLAVGDPASDVANFCAQLDLLVIRGVIPIEMVKRVKERFVESYLEDSKGVSMQRIQWYYSASLLRLCLWPFRQFNPEWPDLTRRMLEKAAEELEAQSW